MALTAQVKDELARLKVDKTSSRKAEVSATSMVGTGVFIFPAAFWLAVLGYVAR